ncbi:MAG: hypothetical protein AB1744_10970, partial [Candidatus Zixiibacteriota bacterium]
MDNSEPENLVWYYAENLWAPAEVHSPFANRVFFINAPYDPTEGLPENMLGLPDGVYCDLNGGQATVGFPNEARNAFLDYGVPIPPGTDLIIFDRGSLDLPNLVTFGFGAPVDADNDGMADNPSGVASYIGGAVSPLPYGSIELLNLAFFDIGDYGQLNPIPNNLFVSVDDAGDYDVDSFEIGFSVLDTAPPTSMVLPFDGEEYWKELEPGQSFSVSAVAADNVGVRNVQLWYRYSLDNWTDNVAWKKRGWQLYGADVSGADGWSWNFTPEKYG